MASTTNYPKPFQSGFRLLNGDDVNSALSLDLLSTENGITAHSGGGQTNAYQLTTNISRITTVAVANDSVKLPPATAGRTVYVDNDGANVLAIYPSGTDQVEDGTGAISFSVGQDGTFVCPIGGKWYQVGSSGGSGNFTSLVLSGATSGTITINPAAIAGTNTLTLPAVTGTSAQTSGSNLYIADVTRCSTQQDATTNTTLANVTGLVQTVVPGTYRFRCVLPGTAGGTGGIKYAFNYTTTVLTSIEASGMGYTASAVAVQHTTTTTTQTTIFGQGSAVIMCIIEGSMVVATGGTINLQMAQNVSNGTTSSTFVGATMEFVRIA